MDHSIFHKRNTQKKEKDTSNKKNTFCSFFNAFLLDLVGEPGWIGLREGIGSVRFGQTRSLFFVFLDGLKQSGRS